MGGGEGGKPVHRGCLGENIKRVLFVCGWYCNGGKLIGWRRGKQGEIALGNPWPRRRLRKWNLGGFLLPTVGNGLEAGRE